METTRGILKSHTSLGYWIIMLNTLAFIESFALTVANGAINPPEAASTTRNVRYKRKGNLFLGAP